MGAQEGGGYMSDVTVVGTIGSHPTVLYAAEEIARIVGVMTGRAPRLVSAGRYDPQAAGIWLALPDDLPGAVVPPVADPKLDDAVLVDVVNGNGVVTGANPRSVLLAAYRMLSEWGCRWVRPGPDGELLPALDGDLTCRLSERPAYRHRGICIEGAVSEEHVRGIIEWLPRVGMNAYFTQFRESHTFFNRWYAHQGNPLRMPEPFDVSDSRQILDRLVGEIARRGLTYHAVGHGWTCEPFGMPGLGWEFDPVQAPPQAVPYLALVKGKREVWEGIPLNTNLCYSNPEVRRNMVEDMLRYVREHPSVDVLHVWLADGANNNCECENCVRARPSDYYVMLLNELDASLTEAGLDTRVVFLIYVDLLWPPERERIANPDRFILMFAPITRSYSRPFAADLGSVPELPPFRRNRLEFPRSVDMNVAFLKAWESAFKGDSFDFDYHFMWDHYNDPGYCKIAAVLHEDVRRLSAIGLNGFMSCQTQRAFFPTGLGMYAMAGGLWDPARTLTEIEEEYFAAAFGPDWRAARGYLYELSELFDPDYVRGDKAGTQEGTNVKCEAPPAFDRVPDALAAFRPVIAEHVESAHPVWRTSWRLLEHHADICEPLARAYSARERGDALSAHEQWAAAANTAWELEPQVEAVLDVYLFTQTLSGRFPKP